MTVEQMASEAESDHISCIACRQRIKANASKCHYCGSYQVRWKNWLPVIGAVFGILTLAASALAVVLATATDFWQELFGSDSIEIIAYSSNQLSVLNSGNRGLFVESVTEESDEVGHYSVNVVHKVVGEGSVHVHRRKGGKAFHEERRILMNVTDKSWAEWKRGRPDSISPFFYSAGHPHLELLRRMSTDLRTFEGKCTARFRAVKSDSPTKEISFPCLGVMTTKKSN